MTKRTAALTSWIVLVLGIAAFAGSALASPPASPGNSANAPGQVKKSSATTSASGGGSASQNGPGTTGVKPTNGTAKGTTCGPAGGSSTSATCAPTGTAATNAQSAGKSDASKRYGNDRTAAQIAVQNGATGATLHGPGNSQPHKAALCPGGHEVDVHALKAKKNKSCGSSSQPTTSNNVSGNVTSSSHAAAGGSTTSAAGPTAQGAAAQGGVLGVTTAANGKPAGGVLGAIEAVGSGRLPFTGFPLWFAALTALSLVVFGLTLRRLGREAA
jgi:hypothetical protein